jgi:hypothetical protein
MKQYPSVQPAIAGIGRGCLASTDLIRWSRRFAALATQQAIKRSEIRTLPALSEEGCRVHGRQLFGNGGCHELVDADSVRHGAALDFRLHRAGEAERVGTLRAFHILILLSNSAGDNTSIRSVSDRHCTRLRRAINRCVSP